MVLLAAVCFCRAARLAPVTPSGLAGLESGPESTSNDQLVSGGHGNTGSHSFPVRQGSSDDLPAEHGATEDPWTGQDSSKGFPPRHRATDVSLAAGQGYPQGKSAEHKVSLDLTVRKIPSSNTQKNKNFEGTSIKSSGSSPDGGPVTEVTRSNHNAPNSLVSDGSASAVIQTVGTSYNLELPLGYDFSEGSPDEDDDGSLKVVSSVKHRDGAAVGGKTPGLIIRGHGLSGGGHGLLGSTNGGRGTIAVGVRPPELIVGGHDASAGGRGRPILTITGHGGLTEGSGPTGFTTISGGHRISGSGQASSSFNSGGHGGLGRGYGPPGFTSESHGMQGFPHGGVGGSHLGGSSTGFVGGVPGVSQGGANGYGRPTVNGIFGNFFPTGCGLSGPRPGHGFSGPRSWYEANGFNCGHETRDSEDKGYVYSYGR
ncbi:oleosin GRP-17-like [Homarus americanus]|nr:oleosin GRP-17-like [Homarus americanus]